MDPDFLAQFLTQAAVFALVCLPIPMVLGMLWYGPLFGAPWMRAVCKAADELTMGAGLILGTAAAWLLTSFAVAVGVGILINQPLVANILDFGGVTWPLLILVILTTIAYLGLGLNHIIMAKNYQGQPYSLAFIDFGYQYLGILLLAIAQFFLFRSGWLGG